VTSRNQLRFDHVVEAAKTLSDTGAIVECCLCKNRAVGVGIFIPFADTSRKLGAPAGKTRVVFYGLCARHRKETAAIDFIEAEIVRRGFVAVN
jgi:hypothetical protein